MAAALALSVLIAWWAKTTLDVSRSATIDEASKADVIAVLGAAEYRGRPSPVLKARLDHALALYRRGLAPRILTTGGAGGDPVFTEGTVGRDYLIGNGVPAESVIVEGEASSTWQSAASIAEIMRRMNLRSCVVVTDGYHVFRVKRMLESGGITAYGSPRPGQPQDESRYWRLCARQAFAYMLWRVGIAV